MKIERPSKVEFVLDNLFAVELLIFPYIILVFRKPTWTSMNGSVIITVLCSIVALICCIIVLPVELLLRCHFYNPPSEVL